MKHSCGVLSLDMLTSLSQPIIKLRCYGWSTSKEGSLRRKNKDVEEIQPSNLSSLGSLASNEKNFNLLNKQNSMCRKKKNCYFAQREKLCNFAK